MSRGFLAGIAVAAACVCQPVSALAGSCIVNPGSETYSTESGRSAAAALDVARGEASKAETSSATETRFMTIVCSPVRALSTLLRGIILMVN